MNLLAALLVAGLLLTTACGPSRDASGALTGAQDVSALDLQVGDCFNGGDQGGITHVSGVPCDEPHVFEVFAVAQHADGEFPGEEALQARGEQLCLPPFEQYVGVPYEESQFVVHTIDPSLQTWRDGDRATLCVLSTEDKVARTGSAEGTAR